MSKVLHLAPAFGRFLIVGLSGTLVNLAVLAMLVTLGLPQLLAAVIATEVSIINNFFWNDSWTFKANRQHSWLGRYIRFQIVASITATLTLGLFAMFTGLWHLHYLLAQFGAIGISTLINFVVNTELTWNKRSAVNFAEEIE